MHYHPLSACWTHGSFLKCAVDIRQVAAKHRSQHIDGIALNVQNTQVVDLQAQFTRTLPPLSYCLVLDASENAACARLHQQQTRRLHSNPGLRCFLLINEDVTEKEMS